MSPSAHRRHHSVQRAEVVLVRQDTEVARWPFVTGARVDLSSVERLARMQLAARRLGCTIRLEEICPRLRELLELTGLGVEVER